MTTNQHELDLIGCTEAAVILNRNERTVLRWAHNGTIPVAVRPPGRTSPYLFERTDVEALARKLRVAPLESVA